MEKKFLFTSVILMTSYQYFIAFSKNYSNEYIKTKALFYYYD